jgi:transposase
MKHSNKSHSERSWVWRRRVLLGLLWDGPLLAAHLRRHYGVSLGVRQCQRIFTQLGFRLRKPRPHVAQSDPGAGAAFKKPAPAGTAQGR